MSGCLLWVDLRLSPTGQEQSLRVECGGRLYYLNMPNTKTSLRDSSVIGVKNLKDGEDISHFFKRFYESELIATLAFTG